MDSSIVMEKFMVKDASFNVPEGVGIVPHGVYTELVAANELMANAIKRAKIIEEQAQIRYEEEQARGYEEGIQEGKLIISEQIMDLVTERLNFLENIETSTVDLVMASLVKILDEMPPQERVLSAVKRAIAYVRNQKKVTLRISPEDDVYVQSALEQLKMAYPSIDILDVYPDKRLKSGDCVLESELGVMDAGLKTQLQNIERAFMKNLSPKSNHE